MILENLDTLKLEIEKYVVENKFAMFRGLQRSTIDRDIAISWDTFRFPDFRDFLSVAAAAGVKIIVFHYLILEPAQIKSLHQHLDEAEIEPDEKRNLNRDLKRLKMYEGFVSSLELSFDLGSSTYLFGSATSWYAEMESILERLDPFLPDFFDEEDEKDGPIGGSGFYSRN